MVNAAGSYPDVFVVADNILSPIGDTTAQNLSALRQGISGVRKQHKPDISPEEFIASLFGHDEDLFIDDRYTRFESLMISSIKEALGDNKDLYVTDRTVLIVSSTKGNIGLLGTEPDSPELHQRIALHTSAQLVANYFGLINKPIVVSNACISGVMALLTGMRLLRSGQYEHAIVVGADVISRFVYSGFKSFQALSADVCKPFDKDRTGLNLGEGAGTIVLSIHQHHPANVKVSSGAISNDANHISGPSRTGEELGYAIKKALLDAGVTANDIGYISGHGTATNYNDEMEAKAITFAGLQNAPLNSLKAYYGHTLGAAGIIESIVAIHAIIDSEIMPSSGYAENGVSTPVNVVTTYMNTKINYALKTASGFGGCNAAMIFSK